MQNNEEDGILTLEKARRKYLECEPLLRRIQNFLKKKQGALLEEQEKIVKEEYRDNIFPMLRNIQRLKTEPSEGDSLDAPFLEIQNLITSGIRGADLEARKQELISLSSEICRKLNGLELRFSSIIGVAPIAVTREIFQNLLVAFGDLQLILAGILMTYKGENDGSTLTERMKNWASVTGSLIAFLTDVILTIPGFGIEEEYLNEINALLNRCIQVYSPDLFFGFLRAIGNSEDVLNHKEKIEDHQRDLGILIDEIKVLTNYS